MKRVVITGRGLVTPLGMNVSDSWNALIQGESGISKIDRFDTTCFDSKIAGEIKQDLSQWIAKKDLRQMGRFIHLGLIAAKEALEDARWTKQYLLQTGTPEEIVESLFERTGVIVGSGIGGLQEIEASTLCLYDMNKVSLGDSGVKRYVPRHVSPYFVPSALVNSLPGHISIAYGFTGPNISVVTACSSGAHAIGESFHHIRMGKADVMVAGGAEAAVCPLGVAGFSSMKALSHSFNECPEKASRPWDKRRDGFVIGEGAGILVLESLDHATARGAKIYGEVVGYAMSSDAYHIAAPHKEGKGAYTCMKAALTEANLMARDIGYVNAHSTSTPVGDSIELNAIGKIFPEGTPVSSTKSSTGHLLGAAGSVEAIFSLLVLETGHMPGTLNLEDPEQTHLRLLKHSEPFFGNYTLSNSFGFGGTNSSLIFKQWE